MRIVRVSKSFVLAVGLVFGFGLAEAQAGHYENEFLAEFDFNFNPATGGSDVNFNSAEFEMDSEDASFSRYSVSDRYFSDIRTIDGSWSNSNDDGTKTVLVQWMFTHADTLKRTDKGAQMNQKAGMTVRVVLYTPSSTVTEFSNEGDSLCGAKAKAKLNEAFGDPDKLTVSVKCKKDAWTEMGFTEDQADCIDEALGKRGVKYVWDESDA